MESNSLTQPHLESRDTRSLSRGQRKNFHQFLTEKRSLSPFDGPENRLEISILDIVQLAFRNIPVVRCEMVGSAVPQFVAKPIPADDIDISVWVPDNVLISLVENNLVAGLAQCLNQQGKLPLPRPFLRWEQAVGEGIWMHICSIGQLSSTPASSSLQLDLSICYLNSSPGLFTPGRAAIEFKEWLGLGAQERPLNQKKYNISFSCSGVSISTWQQSFEQCELLEPHPEHKYRGLFRYPKWISCKGFLRNPTLEEALWNRVFTDFRELQSSFHTTRIFAEMARRLPQKEPARSVTTMLWGWLIDDSPLSFILQQVLKTGLAALFQEIGMQQLLEIYDRQSSDPDPIPRFWIEFGLLKLGMSIWETESQGVDVPLVGGRLGPQQESRLWRNTLPVGQEVHWPSPFGEHPAVACARLIERFRRLAGENRSLPSIVSSILQRNGWDDTRTPLAVAIELCEEGLLALQKRSSALDMAIFFRYLSLLDPTNTRYHLRCRTSSTPTCLLVPYHPFNRLLPKQQLYPLPSALNQTSTMEEISDVLQAHLRKDWGIFQWGGERCQRPEQLAEIVKALASWDDPFWTLIRCQLLCLLARIQPDRSILAEHRRALVAVAQGSWPAPDRVALMQAHLPLSEPGTAAVAAHLEEWIMHPDNRPATAWAIESLTSTASHQDATDAHEWSEEHPEGVDTNLIVAALASHSTTQSLSYSYATDSGLSVSNLLDLLTKAHSEEQMLLLKARLSLWLKQLPPRNVDEQLLLTYLNILKAKNRTWAYEALSVMRRRELLQRGTRTLLNAELIQADLDNTALVTLLEWIEQDGTILEESVWLSALERVSNCQSPSWMGSRFQRRQVTATSRELGFRTVCALASTDTDRAVELYEKFLIDFREEMGPQQAEVLFTLASHCAKHQFSKALMFYRAACDDERANKKEKERALEVLLRNFPSSELGVILELLKEMDTAILSTASLNHLSQLLRATDRDLDARAQFLLTHPNLEAREKSALWAHHIIKIVENGELTAASDLLRESKDILSEERAKGYLALIEALLQQEPVALEAATVSLRELQNRCADQPVLISRARLKFYQAQLQSGDFNEVFNDLRRSTALSEDASLASEYGALYDHLLQRIPLESHSHEDASRMLLLLRAAYADSGAERDDFPGIGHYAKYATNVDPYFHDLIPYFSSLIDSSISQDQTNEAVSNLLWLGKCLSRVEPHQLTSPARYLTYLLIMGHVARAMTDDLLPSCDEVFSYAEKDPHWDPSTRTDRLLTLLTHNQAWLLETALLYADKSEVYGRGAERHPYYVILRRCADRVMAWRQRLNPADWALYGATVEKLIQTITPPTNKSRHPQCTQYAFNLAFIVLASLERDCAPWRQQLCHDNRLASMARLIAHFSSSDNILHRIVAAEMLLFARAEAFPPGDNTARQVFNGLDNRIRTSINLTGNGNLQPDYQLQINGATFERHAQRPPSVWQLGVLIDPSVGLSWPNLMTISNPNREPKAITGGSSPARSRRGGRRGGKTRKK